MEIYIDPFKSGKLLNMLNKSSWIYKCLRQIAFGAIFGAVFGAVSSILASGSIITSYVVKGSVSFSLCAVFICLVVTIFSPKE